MQKTYEAPQDFEKYNFNEFLAQLGLSKDEYRKALRGSVRINCEILPKRECKDVFINNYNPRILQDDPLNHDIQIIAGEEGAYACAVYAAKYLSKDEEGPDDLLGVPCSPVI